MAGHIVPLGLRTPLGPQSPMVGWGIVGEGGHPLGLTRNEGHPHGSNLSNGGVRHCGWRGTPLGLTKKWGAPSWI